MSTRSTRKEQTRQVILSSAARLLRERGIAGANVVEVMKGAGLTVGGFYAHFASKEDLVAQTLRGALREMRSRLTQGLEDRPAADRLTAILQRYLSRTHRDHADRGCPLPAVAGEIATSERAYAKALAEEIAAWATAEAPCEVRGLSTRELMLGLTALMVGGVALARAVRGTSLSDDILRASRALGRAAVHALVVEHRPGPRGES